MDDVVTQVGAFAPLIMNAVKALVVLILGWIVAGAIAGAVRRRINKRTHVASEPRLPNRKRIGKRLFLHKAGPA